MSNITVALGSFTAGIFSVLILTWAFGTHTSTIVQLASAQQVVIAGAEPTVPPLKDMVFHGNVFAAGGQALDGLVCEACTFNDVSFTYSGGASRLVNPKFTGKIHLELKGAAANTAMLLAFLQAVAANARPPAANPNTPILRSVTAKQAYTANLVMPYDGRK